MTDRLGIRVAGYNFLCAPSHGRAQLPQQQQIWKAVRPSRRAGQFAGRPNVAAAGLEDHPSELEAGRAGQQPIWKSVRPGRLDCWAARGGRANPEPTSPSSGQASEPTSSRAEKGSVS
jgi:hypothetical protein